MTAVPSSMLPLGTSAPDFTLPDVVHDVPVSLSALPPAQGTVIMFICNHCPYVVHLMPALVAMAKTYQEKGIRVIAISANDIENYPQDAPEKMKALMEELGHPFTYLYDASQDVAKAYQAACTPDFYLFDQALKCVYRGRFDAATPKNNTPVTGEELLGALDNLLAGKEIPEEPQYPSIGCNIKWKA
ncbi:thioredoxin family protein [Candidatus Venteria ishoeyi]|uniref:Thiol-disulfide oxidoreductase n=1 Tax=Candidatus Venteria ishoeyi TaxID=1899563 RepID=A0A1H6F2Y7_9GAMM|nr:thioredoxin family protein [Candidatus Venteria ishoeyi]MDM8547943.1 thioredoxin family protein [Candidatus Venteria ishoeyi]SEH04432.1 thiol-disulfide oxidoreductase [Candidatus Venteria ishoeyi]